MAQWQTLSDRINTVAPSATLAVDSKAKAMKAAGLDVVGFGAGEPNFPTPANVVKAAADACLDPKNYKYTPTPGLPELREAIAAKMLRDSGYEVNADQVVVTNGGKQAVYESFQILLNDGDEVIIPAPYWTSYPEAVKLAGGVPVEVFAGADVNFEPSLEALEAARTEHTKAIIVNSPNNPSGVVFSQETLEKVGAILGAAAEKYGHPVYIIADEPYRELVYDGVEVPFIPNVYKDTIVCYSWSKSLSLPGERIGYVLVPDDATDSAELFAAVAGAARMLGHVCAPSLIQRAVAACCDIMPDLEAYDVNRNLLYNGLTEIGYECAKPQGAFYLFVKAPGGDAMAFAEKAKKKNLLIVPSDSFGVPGYFRLSYCVSKEMIERSLPAFKEVFAE